MFKNHTYLLDAFSSGDTGCIGFVEEGILRTVEALAKAGGSSSTSALKSLKNFGSQQNLGLMSNCVAS
jgi:hypothetical protein